MDWIMYTVGVISHIWVLLGIIALIHVLSSFKVQYLQYEVKIHTSFYVSWVGVIAFWMWFFFG